MQAIRNPNHFYPTAKVVADSLNCATGDRLTTMICKYHRFIHSEVLTHRVMSRNSSSSRSISVKRLIQNVIDDNVYPLHWGLEQRGMQASREISEDSLYKAIARWDVAREQAIYHASGLSDISVHKQVVNRILEPFSTITVIISATTWDNFFEQRDHSDAQPEIQALASEMQLAYKASEPVEIYPGDWHVPLTNMQDTEEFPFDLASRVKLSSGRCARVSYLSHEGIRDLKADIDLHDRLVAAEPKHLSPLEHQAVALPESVMSANFRGFKQYRKFVEMGHEIN